MKAVVLDVSERQLDERRRKGLDVFDEMWQAVLHMVPPPSGLHQALGSGLIAALWAPAQRRGLVATYQTGLFAADDDYRVPDVVISDPRHRTERGVDVTAQLVIELLSPRDETYEKLSWYAALAVDEILIIEPSTRRIEMFVSCNGEPIAVQPDADGGFVLQSLGARIGTVDTPSGTQLRISVDDAETLL